MRSAVLCVALAACAYRPGSFTHYSQEFVGQRTTVGCIDLAVERRADTPGGSAVLAYDFGNRCDHPATIDFAHVKVLARTYDGKDLTLEAYDPDWEIRPLELDGRATGHEALAYPSDDRIAEVCVDAASLAHEGPPRWLCFASVVPPQLERDVAAAPGEMATGARSAVAEVSP